jgi:hypothetical protein
MNWSFTVESENTIKLTVRTTTHSRRGTRREAPRSATFTLDEAREIPSRGGGEGVWTFADGTLTSIRTFKSGARRVSFAFARGADGLTCAASFAFAREDGSGPVRLRSRSGDRDVVIVSAKQVSSTCRVTRPVEPAARNRS